MIYLNTSTRSLMAVLSANVSTTQLDVTACFYDVPSKTKDDYSEYRGAVALTTTANSTAITAVGAPPSNTVRNVISMFFFNADTTTATLLVKYSDTGTTKTMERQALLPGETLVYETGAGWQIT